MRKELNLLIVDDNPADSNLVKRMVRGIEAFPVAVQVESEYKNGLRVLHQEDIDCVLLDYHLGAVSGLEVLQSIRKMGIDTPVVMLTGQGNETLAAETIKAGAQGYLPKDQLTAQSIQKAVSDAITSVEWARLEHSKHQELEQFVSIASHDMRRPLRHIYFYLQLLKEEVGDKLSEDGKHYFDTLEQTITRSRELLQSLLDLAKYGQDQRAHQELDLSALVRAVTKESEEEIQSKNVTITQDELPMVIGDSSQLFQLFSNLINNAIKYSDKDAPIIHVSCESNQEGYLLAVKDNGPGIPPEHCEKIFQSFYRIPQKKGPQGSGLGLSICQKIVASHGGKIWVTSESGDGTTFWIQWPSEQLPA